MLFYAFFSIFFAILLNFFNLGKFSITLLFSYFLGFEIVVSLLQKLVVIFEKAWYNKVKDWSIKFLTSLKNHKRKDKKSGNEISSKS